MEHPQGFWQDAGLSNRVYSGVDNPGELLTTENDNNNTISEQIIILYIKHLTISHRK